MNTPAHHAPTPPASAFSAIPTMHKGIQFRSRLEARWAAFFDLCGWSWEYEPIDLAGYIPDFVLKFKKPVIVEVKPTFSFEREGIVLEAMEKVERSGWSGDAILVGAHLRDKVAASQGLGLGVIRTDAWRDLVLWRCTKCEKNMFSSVGAKPACDACAVTAPRLPVVALRADGPKDKPGKLATISSVVSGCRCCPLASERTQTVFARGSPDARIMFVGEAPGVEEDRLGDPFVGRAGQLLDTMLAEVGIQRDSVYIANVVKCRPPGNRVPASEEIGACGGFLSAQIDIVKPDLIVALGATASRFLLGSENSMASLRGRFFEHRRIPLLCTYHPAYLLRCPSEREKTAADLAMGLRRLGISAPEPAASADLSHEPFVSSWARAGNLVQWKAPHR